MRKLGLSVDSFCVCLHFHASSWDGEAPTQAVLQTSQPIFLRAPPMRLVLTWAASGANLYCGGLLLLIGGILEFFLGNTFAFVVFGTYGTYLSTYPLHPRRLETGLSRTRRILSLPRCYPGSCHWHYAPIRGQIRPYEAGIL